LSFLKKITGWDTAKKPADELAWFHMLGDLDDLAALEIIIQRLCSCSGDKLSDLARLKLLSDIDKQNRSRLTKITTQYIRFDSLRPELKTRIFELAYSYYRQTFLLYFGLIEKFTAKPDQHIFDYEWLQILLSRATSAAMNMVKWRSFVQMAAPAHVWLQLFGIFRIAADENLLDIPTALFDDEPSITASALLAQAFMLGSLEQANMNCQQVQIVSQLLKLWMPTAGIHKSYEADKFLFYIDMKKDVGARRIRNFEPENSYRYLDIQHFNFLVAEAIAGLEAKSLPAHLMLGGFSDHNPLLDTLKILRNEWSKTDYKRQRRRENRNKSAKSATLCYGVEEICRQALHLANYNLTRGGRVSAEGKSLDERLASHSVIKSAPNVYFTGSSESNWLIVDESPRGYGLRVDAESAAQASPGKLVGLVLKDQKDQLAIGLVKAIKPLANKQYHIGIEIITRNPVWCQLTHAHKSAADTTTQPGVMNSGDTAQLMAFPSLYLPKEEGFSERASLILPRIEFTQHHVYQVNLKGIKSLASLTQTLAGQYDWVQVATDIPEPSS
jgi:cyclic-di-GMP-binding protein